jgi:hypothetical protein
MECGDEWYKVIKYEPITAILLINFIISDIGRRIPQYIKIFESDEDYAGAMNATQYTKIDNIVTITPEWVADDEESIAKGNYFSIKASVLADLLRHWVIVYAEQPPYIMISIAEDKALIIGLKSLEDFKKESNTLLKSIGHVIKSVGRFLINSIKNFPKN